MFNDHIKYNALKSLFDMFAVSTAEFDNETHCTTYLGHCELFDELKDDEMFPTYNFFIKKL